MVRLVDGEVREILGEFLEALHCCCWLGVMYRELYKVRNVEGVRLRDRVLSDKRSTESVRGANKGEVKGRMNGGE